MFAFRAGELVLLIAIGLVLVLVFGSKGARSFVKGMLLFLVVGLLTMGMFAFLSHRARVSHAERLEFVPGPDGQMHWQPHQIGPRDEGAPRHRGRQRHLHPREIGPPEPAFRTGERLEASIIVGPAESTAGIVLDKSADTVIQGEASAAGLEGKPHETIKAIVKDFVKGLRELDVEHHSGDRADHEQSPANDRVRSDLTQRSDAQASSNSVAHGQFAEAAAEASPAAPTSAERDLATSSKRPEWVDGLVRKVAGVDFRKVSSGPYPTLNDCELALNEALRQECEVYLDLNFDAGWYSLPVSYIRNEMILEEWVEPINSPSVGAMLNKHALLRIDARMREDFKKQIAGAKDVFRRQDVNRRLSLAGSGAGLVLGFLGTILSYLKLDTITRGYYTRRLQLLAGTTILGLAAAAVYVVRVL